MATALPLPSLDGEAGHRVPAARRRGTVGLGEARPDIESVTLAARPEVSLTR